MTHILNFSPGFLRAWAAFSVAFALVLSQGTARAQSNDTSSSGTGNSTSSTSGSTASGTVTTPDNGVSPDGTMPSPSGDARVPPPTSLLTGQPLWSTMSPLRWSHLSLLSLSATGIYDTNYSQSQQSVPGTEMGMISAIAAFSIRHNRSAIDLQYRPSIWYVNGHLNKDWSGHLVDLQTAFAITPRDTLVMSDRFRYTPSRNPLTDQGFSADFSNFLLTENPFLVQGTTALMNNFAVTLTHVIDGANRLEFQASQEFVKLTQPPITPQPQIICIPGLPFCIIEPGPPPKGPVVQVQPTLGLTAKWTHQFNARSSFNINYGFQRAWLRGTFEQDTEYNHIGAGYTRGLTESVTISLEAGPTFQQSVHIPGPSPLNSSVGLQGEADLFKRFRNGDAVLSVQRQYSFAGQFSDSAHTTIQGSVNQKFGTRWGVTGGASMIRQEFSQHSPTYGYTTWADVSYSLARSWSLFSGWRYLHLTNSAQGYAPRNSIYGGIRWGWSPEQPHD